MSAYEAMFIYGLVNYLIQRDRVSRFVFAFLTIFFMYITLN